MAKILPSMDISSLDAKNYYVCSSETICIIANTGYTTTTATPVAYSFMFKFS